MLLAIPHQTLEIGNIHLTPFQPDKYGKSIARMTYKDNSIEFQDVSILTPPLRVNYYNPENSRLSIDLSDQHHFQVKLNTLHEYLVSTFYIHQQSFLSQQHYSPSNIRDLFHFFLTDSILSLYVFSTSVVKKKDGADIKVSDLKEGDMIRCIIRFQGILQISNKYGTKLRLQHSIPSLWSIVR
jgi:hypothetical protein